MATTTVYHAGGFNAVKPAQNKAEEWTPTGYTRWNTSGVLVETRALTPDEAAQLSAQDVEMTRGNNESALRVKATQAIEANDTFLSLNNPTNAQVAAHVQRLTRENTAIIRIILGALDSIDGT